MLGTKENLSKVLKIQPIILHFIGHGIKIDNELFLVLENLDGSGELINM